MIFTTTLVSVTVIMYYLQNCILNGIVPTFNFCIATKTNKNFHDNGKSFMLLWDIGWNDNLWGVN